ncbi:hypothetical protein PAMC26510_35325 [Caballeronia sordidicola]|uniref:Uncharacterized protein n=1 Tax=Caballeronia sordidicola TaxID=196367 RepID=A0A242M5Y0_CABSO|nr:hypothetical protein PAMC26510_35325 [Caballeronia sordidicola]
MFEPFFVGHSRLVNRKAGLADVSFWKAIRRGLSHARVPRRVSSTPRGFLRRRSFIALLAVLSPGYRARRFTRA